MPTSPSEEELTRAIIELKKDNPELGISKVHSLLTTRYPDWTVSEKRTRKILQAQKLVVTAPGNIPTVLVYPSSALVPSLDVQKWTPKVAVKWFDKRKGKGLVATQEIKEGEVLWREDPFIVAPEWGILDLQMKSVACAYCTTPLTGSPLILSCAASNLASTCHARFCNRLCFTRSAKVHPLLCPSKNPASIPLIQFVRDARWMALYALILCTSRLLLEHQTEDKSFTENWEMVRALAELGMEERHKYSYDLSGEYEPDRETWAQAYELFIQTFKEPASTADAKKLAKILRKPYPSHFEADIFSYDTGFLHGLGRMSLNLEAHGGLYTLHSHLNHSCDPNLSIRHIEQHTALSRITAIAKRAIHIGEELLITYVDPQFSYRTRQDELKGWGFGTCTCPRCLEEVKTLEDDDDKEMADLASELKAGLGVM